MKIIALLRALATALTAALGPRELGLLAGLALIAYGVSQIFLPAAYFLPGAILVYIAIVGLS